MGSNYYVCMTSHRRRHDETRWAWRVALAATVVGVSAAGIAWRLMPAPPGGWPGAGQLAAASGTGAGTLLSALGRGNESGPARGLLPPSACTQDGLTTVTCMAPAPGVTGVVFSVYPSLRALYAAYAARVETLNSGQFADNPRGCEQSLPAVAGEVTGPRAPGRLFCTAPAGGQEDIVWTQADGNLLGWAAGGPHQDVWTWWAAIRDNIAFPAPRASAAP